MNLSVILDMIQRLKTKLKTKKDLQLIHFYLSNIKFSRFHTFFDIQLKISSEPVDGFSCKIAFWKRY